MQPINNTKYLLVSGFSLILILLAALTLSSLSRVESLTGHLNQIVNLHDAKREYIYLMYNAARERALLLNNMLLSETDPFMRDTLHMRFAAQASEFIRARTAYQQFEMDGVELRLLEKTSQRTRTAYATQKVVLDALLAGQYDDARQEFLQNALSAQQDVLDALQELLALQKNLSRQAIYDAENISAQGYFSTLILGLSAFGLGVLVSVFVVLRISSAEKMLRKAKDSAEELARIKSDFLANMSHEIRTPLNAVIGMSELLHSTELDEHQRDYVETIHTSGRALLSVINDILDFSKIEAGMLELESSPFDLRRCIEEVLELQAPRADEKGLELIYYIDAAVESGCRGDMARLRQILLNLVGNAVKFTSHGEVTIRVGLYHDYREDAAENTSAKPRQLHFQITDSGIGIPTTRIGQLFAAFTQGDASTSRRFGGTGLGLVICKRLCELMGGDIWVESQEGKGATFHFRIVAPTAEIKQLYDSSNRQVLSGKHVLLVDDNQASLSFLFKQLEDWQMRVSSFRQGRDALAMLTDKHDVDLAIVDMRMPNMDGIELAQKLFTFHIPVILLSSLRYVPKPSPFLTAVLTKPVRICPLFEQLVTLCGGHLLKDVRVKTAISQYGKRYPLKILLAEDNPVNQKVATLMLKKIGYQADLARNGSEVLSRLENDRYEVILMDVQMPEIDGLEATRRIRQRWDKPPYIIAMTANVMQEDVQQCMDAGMQAHIGKPVQTSDLSATLEKAYKALHPDSSHTDNTLIDQDIFAELRQLLGGDLLALKDLIDTYIHDAPQLLNQLQQAIATQEPQKILDTIQPLRSSSASLGAYTIAALCGELEQAVRIQYLHGIGSKFRALELELTRVIEVLPDFLMANLDHPPSV